jgi:hypothetical protein
MQILSPMPWIYGKLEPFLSLALLMGNPDYQTHFDYECQLDSGYFRVHPRIDVGCTASIANGRMRC